jgi:putative component of membrane protein insertase Oxa1/YidC/SpoIIIJ protein YidD
MIEAVRTHGAVKGFLLGVSRLSRCRPFGPSGYDPVPPMGKWKNDFNLKESKNEQD